MRALWFQWPNERNHYSIGEISTKQSELKHLAKLPVLLLITLSFVGCTTPEQRELAAMHELLEISEQTEFPTCVAEHAGDGGSINAKDPTHIKNRSITPNSNVPLADCADWGP